MAYPTPLSPALDSAAAALSSLCLLHCLLLPLGLALAPVVAAVGPADLHGPEWLHWALLGLAAPVSIFALHRGIALHGDHRPWQMAALGFALMALGALVHELGPPAEQLLTVAGGLVVAGAHWRNWRRQRPAVADLSLPGSPVHPPVPNR